jgi:hypothetical protein
MILGGMAQMALFKTDPQKTMQRDIDAAKTNLTRLRTQLADAERAVSTHREQAKTAAVTGADAHVLDLAEAATRAAQDRVGSLSAAVVEVESQLAALETAKAEAQDNAQREQTSAQCEMLARRVVESAETMIKAAAAFADHIAKASAFIPEAGGLLHFATIVGNEIPAAVAQTSKLLRARGASVLAGTAPPTLPAPPEAYVPPPVAPGPATQTLFTTRAVKFVGVDGRQMCVAQFVDATLPLKAAKRGLALRALVPLSDPIRSKNNRGAVGAVGNPAHALDLDLDSEPVHEARPPPVMHSAFEQPKIGEPRILRFAATRSEPT